MGMVIDRETGEVTEDEPTTEPENPDAEPEEPLAEPEEPEEEEPEAHVPASLTVLAERDRKLESETRRHENALRKLYGDDFETLAPCPLCLADGWVAPTPPGVMDPEQWLAIQAASGQLTDAEYRDAPYAVRCETCDGWGEVASGSRTEAGRLIVCRDCSGNGWREQVAQTAGVPMVSAMHPVLSNGSAEDPASVLRDQWNRPAGHRHFGIPPDQLD